MLTALAVLTGKSIAYLSRILKLGGGTAAPGFYALKIQPSLVEKLVRKIPRNIIITGTNGKTTTARMVAHMANEAGLKVTRNHTGSNLERGIASTLISNCNLSPVPCNLDLGIWELDEAAFNPVAPKINPDIVVFLNVSRDQLDRYGEVDKVVNDWCQTLKDLPKDTTVLINGDDQNLGKLQSFFNGKIMKFVLPKNIKQKGLDGSQFSLFVNRYSLIVNLPLPGLYHVYDAVAALTVAQILKLPLKTAIDSFKTFTPAFGRVEKFTFQPQGLEAIEGYIFLIKNPAGATAVFETVAPQIKNGDRLLLALNDNLADGTDVSWIWDADFEQLTMNNEQLTINCSGSRAYDLANRLKYAGFSTDKLEIEPDVKKAFKDASEALNGRIFVLPTYTAMLELQKVLVKQGIKPHYWKEEL